ncbi:MAG: hypothetical protein G01um101425_1036 [Candidatus Peregrinibacteria bacterium Gr01-1014_25]|nr:MAG: hypothetical protein G01um101425_1036 [Candidatus Peregrinibacteria bacterium Gr01-1014_25]
METVHAAMPALTVSSAPVPVTAVAPGSQRVPVLRVMFRATCDAAVTVRSLNLLRRGQGSAADIAGVHALDGWQRVSRVASVQRDGAAIVRLGRLTLEPCGQKTLTIVADIGASAARAGEHRFVLTQASDIDAADATVLLVPGSLASQTARVAGPERSVVTVAYPQLTEPVRYGEHRTIARLRLGVEGEDDVRLQTILLTNDGSARDDDVQNIVLESSSGQRLTGTAAQMDGESVLLTFQPPLLIGRNEERLMKLTADVRASKRRTIRFLVEEPGDIVAVPVRGRR